MTVRELITILRQKAVDELTDIDPQISLFILQNVRETQVILQSIPELARRVNLRINTDEKRLMKGDLRYNDVVMTITDGDQRLEVERPCTAEGLHMIGTILDLEMQRRDANKANLENAVVRIRKAFDGFHQLKRYIAESGLEKQRGLKLYIQTSPAQFASGQTQKEDIILQIPQNEGKPLRMRFACSMNELERCRTLVNYIHSELRDSNARDQERERRATVQTEKEGQEIKTCISALQPSFKDFGWKLGADWKTGVANLELKHHGRTIRAKLPIDQSGCRALELLVDIEGQRRGGDDSTQPSVAALPNSATCYKRIKALAARAKNLKSRLEIMISPEDAEAGRTSPNDVALFVMRDEDEVRLDFRCDYRGLEALSANLDLLEALRKKKKKSGKKKSKK